MMKKNHKYLHQFFLLVSILTATSCNKADNYYRELYDKPELMDLDYRTTYEVGDTMTIYGRLHLDRNTSLRIGDAEAKIIDKGLVKVSPIDTTEFLKVIIAEEMGVGNNRPVRITTSLSSLDAKSINIYSSAGAGYLNTQLKLVSYHNLPANAAFLNSFNGNGNVWYWADGQLLKVKADGQVITILQNADLSDAHGSFTVRTFYSGAVDPAEKYLYFSVLTTDASADNTLNNIIRLCRFDLQNKTLSTLNRTLLRKGAIPNILTTAPLEGKIEQVNLSAIGQMYTATNGDLYLQPRLMQNNDTYEQRYASLLLTAGGQLSYMLKSRIYGEDVNTARLPGVAITELQGIIDADAGLMFTHGTNDLNTIACYNLQFKTRLYTFATTKMSTVEPSTAPVIYGDFAGLSGDPGQKSITGAPARFGFMPMGKGRLCVLYFQGVINSLFSNFPRLGILDFPNQRGDAYAPGKLETNGFAMNEAPSSSPIDQGYIYNNKPTVDKMLNHDADGQIYSSANNRKVLVKTVKK